MQASTLAVQAAVDPQYMATVTTSVQFVRSLGQVFGVAVMKSVFNNKLMETLQANFPLDGAILRVTQDYAFIYEYPPLEIKTIIDSFAHALHYVFYCSAAFCAMALIMSSFIEYKELKTNANQGGAKPELSVDMA